MFLCLSVFVFKHECMCLQRPKPLVSPKVRVTDGCEPPDMDAGSEVRSSCKGEYIFLSAEPSVSSPASTNAVTLQCLSFQHLFSSKHSMKWTALGLCDWTQHPVKQKTWNSGKLQFPNFTVLWLFWSHSFIACLQIFDNSVHGTSIKGLCHEVSAFFHLPDFIFFFF